MIETPILLALTVLGVSLTASGAVLLSLRQARVSAVLLILAGLGCVLGIVLFTSGRVGASETVFTAAATLGLAPALMAYPQLTWRHAVDFVALATVAGAGVLATAQAPSGQVVQPMCMVIVGVVVAHTWWRIERADALDRRALVWMALAGGLAGLVGGFAAFLPQTVFISVGVALLWSLLGPAMVVGATRPEIVDVRGLVVHVAVFFVVLIAYIAVFVALASLLEVVGGGPPGVGLLAVVGALVATTFHPFRVVLRGVIDELLFGQRPDPLAAASRVAVNIGDDPALALRAIRESLVLPYASLIVDDTEVATSGTAVTHTRTLALSIGDDSVGQLVVGLRPGDLILGSSDARVLSLVAPLLAQTLRARALAADLQESRSRTIAALEDERRRLRRDLHDGLGPRLSGIAFTSDAARNLLRSDPEAADELLRTLRTETNTAIADIRQLVYGMRPPALDELGLVPALRQQAATLRTEGGETLRVGIQARQLPPLPAAVEVAAYRIVVEALTNVARHSGASTATVRVDIDHSDLLLEVVDNGPASTPWVNGIGLTSMRERATELGGSLEAGHVTSGGRVRALLPMR